MMRHFFAHTWGGRMVVILVAVLLFALWEWQHIPQPIRLVGKTPLGITMNNLESAVVGKDGVLRWNRVYPEYVGKGEGAAVELIGWDGTIRWRVPFSTHSEHHEQRRYIRASADAHLLAELWAGKSKCQLTTWRDGKQVGSAEFSEPLLNNRLFRGNEVIVRNDGRVLVTCWKTPVLHLLVVEGNAVIARGSYRLADDDEAPTIYAVSGGTAFFCFQRKVTSVPNLRYCDVRIARNTVAVRERYTEQAAGGCVFQHELVRDQKKTIFTRQKIVKQRVQERNFGNHDRGLIEQNMFRSDSAYDATTVLNPDTGKRWRIPFYGTVDIAHVTPDGRFVAISGNPKTSPLVTWLKQHSSWLDRVIREPDNEMELRIYERPGILRARAVGTGKSAIRGNTYPRQFLFSPDGHTVVFPEYAWKVYRW